MFWLSIVIFTVIIVAASVLAGMMLSRPRGPADVRRQDHITALKASGALRHRKSNRP